MKQQKRPILVTGSHRSGSTWVGRTLASVPNVAFLLEPFNIHHDMGMCGAHFEHWYTYICSENESQYLHHLEQTLALQYSLKRRLVQVKTPRGYLGAFRRLIYHTRHRLSSSRVLLKDPIALFSTEWLADRFDLEVLVLIRHPAAFAGSLKANNWTHPFSHFLKQPLLMRDCLSTYSDQIREYAKTDVDVVDQAALMWVMIHELILKYREEHPGWLFIRHEDLSLDPRSGFKSIMKKIDLEYSDEVDAFIQWHTEPKSQKEIQPSTRLQKFSRDSRENISLWKRRLTEEEINRVRTQTEHIADKYYSADEW